MKHIHQQGLTQSSGILSGEVLLLMSSFYRWEQWASLRTNEITLHSCIGWALHKCSQAKAQWGWDGACALLSSACTELYLPGAMLGFSNSHKGIVCAGSSPQKLEDRTQEPEILSPSPSTMMSATEPHPLDASWCSALKDRSLCAPWLAGSSLPPPTPPQSQSRSRSSLRQCGPGREHWSKSQRLWACSQGHHRPGDWKTCLISLGFHFPSCLTSMSNNLYFLKLIISFLKLCPLNPKSLQEETVRKWLPVLL